MIKTITYTVDEYPLLTLEILASLERRVNAKKTTRDDFDFIDHYITSIGEPPGFLLEIIEEEAVFSFDEAVDLLHDPEADHNEAWPTPLPAASITGTLLGCIHRLQRLVKAGEKIY